uniref:Envelope glycoprotein n=1 Tax=Zosterops lateralis melanops TaxID=1220523 RepID=A0A8D2P6W1_ZOSLA
WSFKTTSETTGGRLGWPFIAMLTLLILLCILASSHGQYPAEWSWSEATIRYTSAQGSYPGDRRPNLATVVQHDSEVYRRNEWGWDRKDWARTLSGPIGEEIKVGCGKVEGPSHEKATSIAITGNLLEPNITSSFTNNVEITKLCKDEPTDCWYNFTLTKSSYVTCNWQNDPADQSVLNSKNNIFPPFTATQGDDIAIQCELIVGSLVEPIHSSVIGPHAHVLHCETQNQNCWLNLTDVQSSYKVVCGENHTKYWGELDINVVKPTTQPPVMLRPQIYEMGPYIIRKTGQQQILFNPEWSLKKVKLLMQNNVSENQPNCSPFLQLLFRVARDITGVMGTGLGILNSIDSEVLLNKLAATTTDLTQLQQPLQSSLSALGTQQWLLSNILPNWEKVNVKDHKMIIDALDVTQNNISLALSGIQAQLWMQTVVASIIREGEEGIFPTEIQKIVWDNANYFEREFQSWWKLVNFTYNPNTNTVTAFVLTISNASVHLIFPIIALGINHDGAILYPSKHREWARQTGEKWQTINLESCIVREHQGFICESNAIIAQDICLDTEQNICHFEVHPNEAPGTVLVYIGNGCACFRTVCNAVVVENVMVDTKNHSNFCVCNFTTITGCDFSYKAPVTSYHLLQSNFTLIHQIMPVPIGMNLTLVKQLLLHQDLIEILEKIKKNGQKTLVTVHHDMKEIHHVMERMKKDAEYRWWDTLFGWSPTATGILNKVCNPIVVLLILVLIGLVLSVILYILNWKIMKQLTHLASIMKAHSLVNIPFAKDTPKVIDTRCTTQTAKVRPATAN